MNKYMVENKMKRWQKSYSPAVSLISVAVLLLIWEGICRAGVVSSLFLPPPTLIISALIDMIQDGEIGVSLAASLYRILLGFSWAAPSAFWWAWSPAPPPWRTAWPTPSSMPSTPFQNRPAPPFHPLAGHR